MGMLAINLTLPPSLLQLDPRLLSQADKLLHKAVTYSPDNYSARRAIGYLLLSNGQEREAITTWQEMNLSGDELVAWGKIAESAGQWESAVVWHQRATVLASQSSIPWHHMAQIYEEQEAWELSLAAYQEAIVRNEWGTLSIRSGDAYARMALIYYSRLQPPSFDEALAVSEAAIQQGSFSTSWSESQVHYLRGRVLWQNGNREEAYKEFQTAVRLNGEDAEAHYWLGTAHYTVANDLSQAEMEMRTALALRPNNKWPYIFLGRIYSEIGRRQEAVELYQQALVIDPNDTAVQERLAELASESEWSIFRNEHGE
jgi:tetratricopeptide (TPR) repeat protein